MTTPHRPPPPAEYQQPLPAFLEVRPALTPEGVPIGAPGAYTSAVYGPHEFVRGCPLEACAEVLGEAIGCGVCGGGA